MKEILIVLYLVLFCLCFGLTVVYLFKVHKLFGYLKDKEPETWKNLGRPHLFFNNTPITGFKFLRFLYRKDYLILANPATREKVLNVKSLLFKGLVGFAVLVGFQLILFIVFFSRANLV